MPFLVPATGHLLPVANPRPLGADCVAPVVRHLCRLVADLVGQPFSGQRHRVLWQLFLDSIEWLLIADNCTVLTLEAATMSLQTPPLCPTNAAAPTHKLWQPFCQGSLSSVVRAMVL